MTRRSKLKGGDPVRPARCGCGSGPPTIRAEWLRPDPVRIVTSTGQEMDSEGHWEVDFLCDSCAAKAIVFTEDPPWRITRIVPDRFVDVLYGPAKMMPRNAIEERKARGG